MNKDVIYIDVDDDITAIIGKVKNSSEKIVALVPPKRIGVLQSAVNLRLLQRTATSTKKRLVLITNNQALMALAASAQLPVAKNAQSKPEIPEIAALEIDDGDDIIKGDELPVGDHAKIGASPERETSTDKAAASIMARKAAPPADGASPSKPKAKKGTRVPNFSNFRKRFVFGGIAALALIIFAVWALVFAPRATVVITARTTDTNVSKTVALSPAAATSFSSGTVKSIRQEQKKSAAVEFDGTGQKDVGTKATGTVSFSTRDIENLGTVIPAGTQLTSSSGLVYVTNQAVTLSLSNYRGANTAVTAVENGDKYNAASGNLSGAPSGVSASFTGPTSGGTTRMVTIVTAEDVQNASQQLASQEDAAVKSQLKNAFGDDVSVIETSYVAAKADPVSSPAVGAEVNGKARLTTEITYSMVGVAKAELTRYLDSAVKEAISDQPDQRVYDNGNSKASFTDFVVEGDATRARLVANGKVGPSINDDEIKDQVKGKQFGDIQTDIEAIQGVQEVDVKFFPFWVRTVPGDTKKITIEFKVNEQN